MPIASVTLIAGRLLCSQIRDYLTAERFRGRDIEWMESSGFIERTFTIKGDIADVRHVYDVICAAFED